MFRINPHFIHPHTGLLRAGKLLYVTGPTTGGMTPVNLTRSGVTHVSTSVSPGQARTFGPYNLDMQYAVSSSGHGSTVSEEESPPRVLAEIDQRLPT